MLSDNAEKLLRQRYYLPGETWEGLVSRVHQNNILGDEPDYYDEVFNDILTLKFLPNSPCLVNSGKVNAGKQACFVVGPTEDSLEDHFETLKDIAEVAKRGGGCGFTGSFIRYEGAKVNGSSHGYAYGPLKFAELVSKAMHMMTQSGFRNMAMLLSLDCEHPNIEEFIDLKSTRKEGDLYNFNQSIMASDVFMNKAISNDKSREAALLYKIARNAWANGEPGLLFFDTINNNTPYKETGETIYATNPCGEQPLPPYLSCNLGSINLNHIDFMTNGEFNYDELERVVRHTTIFLDNVGTTNTFPNDKFKLKYDQFRPIGLGIMGYADLLLKLKLAYGSKDALDLLAKILDTIQKVSYNESEMLGVLRGVPEKCKHVNRRNITCQSIAPTGSISHIANLLGGGCEPIFSGSFTRVDERGQTYFSSHEDSDKDYFRSVIGPKSVSIDEHINTQALSQQYVDSGVSKTINLPNDATVEDVYQGFIKAWKLGCKGITVYRDGSRTSQVLNNGTEIKKKFSELNPTNLTTSKCGCDNSNVVISEGCEHCTNCGWSACSIG